MNKLMQMKAAHGHGKSHRGGNQRPGNGGAGLGLMMPAMLAQYFTGHASSGDPAGKRGPFQVPGMRPQHSKRCQVLPRLRSPATGFPEMRSMRQEPHTKRPVLLQMRPCRGREAGTSEMPQLRGRRVVGCKILRSVRGEILGGLLQ